MNGVPFTVTNVDNVMAALPIQLFVPDSRGFLCGISTCW